MKEERVCQVNKFNSTDITYCVRDTGIDLVLYIPRHFGYGSCLVLGQNTGNKEKIVNRIRYG